VSRLWNIADLIDLHFFCRLDEEVQTKEGEAALAKRDRVIYLTKIQPQLRKHEEISPQVLVRRWLAIRRLQFRRKKGGEGEPLPGSLWQELSILARTLVVVIGLLMGAGAAGSLLLYSGTTPLNVSLYFGLFVVAQLVMVLVQACLLLYRFVRRLPLEATSLYMLLGRAMVRFMERTRRRVHRRLSGKQRLDLAALIGGIGQRRELGVLLVWPAFILVQLGGIGFNLGVLGATLSKVIFSDMAFAWQSSLQLSPELVAKVVHWIALPWSWYLPQAVPSLAEIQGSQMILKEGISQLSSANLVAWWPFLCCSVALYGLLPRFLLLLIGSVRQRQALEGLNFSSLNFRPLLRRMTAPRVDTGGVQPPKPASQKKRFTPETISVQPDPADSEISSSQAPQQEDEDTVLEKPLESSFAEGVLTQDSGMQEQGVVIIPDELYEECPLEELRLQLAQIQPHLKMRLQGYDETEPVASLNLDPARFDELFVLFEAWQPPLKETENCIRGLRLLLGREFPITILLIGKPASQTMLTSVDANQLGIWQMKMQALGDGNLAVQPLILP